ncbi:MAG: hypothetical protein B6D39_04120 [Anaerolineae bacterium UTCFX2]|nr:hypothetical protein [Anaerolineae bacterium]MCZ7552618.1 DUF6504 family protein [Anaerolineales bacterium]OQY92881.1 MAG: hypothetical protein B6D39_04120 [Anaerolineae bacterium UTCFX2]
MKPLHFINEPIEAVHNPPPRFEKKPGPPAAFIWRGERFNVVEVLSEWHDYRRRGRMARNMQPAHAQAAEARGSWGVGQDYFQVRTDGGRVFELYYDRAPADSDHRKGGWFLYREMEEQG